MSLCDLTVVIKLLSKELEEKRLSENYMQSCLIITYFLKSMNSNNFMQSS